MANASKKRVIVVGGGLAGLACTIKLAEEGVTVDLFSMVPVKRSHSVCAQGGINACNDIARQQGAHSWELRTATSLARLWRERRRIAQARHLLAPVYGRFSEGFATADLRTAKSVMDELA